MKYIIGVDPGLDGALAFFREGELIGVRDMPVMANPTGKGRQVDCIELAELLRPFQPPNDTQVIIEAVTSMPNQGVASTFNFGRAAMAPEAIALAFRISVEKITPQVWKRKAKLIKKEKSAALSIAKNKWPTMSQRFRLKKHIGRADAALIGFYGGNINESENGRSQITEVSDRG